MKYWPTALILVLLALSCKAPESPSATTPRPLSRGEIMRGSMRAGTWRFVYCDFDAEDRRELALQLERMAKEQPRGKRIEVVDCRHISEDSLAQGPLMWFGDQLPDPTLDAVSWHGDTVLLFDGRHPLDEHDLLALPYARNPYNAGKSTLGLFFSADHERLLDYLGSQESEEWDNIFWARWAYEIHRPDGDRIYGNYLDTTWTFDRENEVHLQRSTDPVLRTPAYRLFAFDGLHPDLDTTRLKGLLDLPAKTVQRTCAPPPRPPLDVYLYPSVERLGIATGEMLYSLFVPEKRELHLYVDPDRLADRTFDPVLWYAFAPRDPDRPPGILREELTAAYLQLNADLTDEQRGQFTTLKAEANTLAALGNLHPDRPAEAASQSDRIRWLLLLHRAVSGFSQTASLSSWMNRQLKLLAAGTDIAVRPQPGNASGAPPPLPHRLAGMTFAHEGYSIYNGYGGRTVTGSMDSLARLNVNAVSIVPYTFQRDPAKPIDFFIPRRAGQETDAATIHSAREAKARGWYVLLKPQIWVGGGSWPGDIGFDSADDWDHFFTAYRYWILHYALLAEAEGIDGLCLGTELVRTTIDHPERWRAIIRDVRQVYHGHLTYAANWGEEFENLTFWNDLDAIGLNSYYPLTDQEDPSDATLLQGAHRWMRMAAAKSRAEDRPLWLTETGFRSVAHPWTNPHAEAGERMMTATDQDRAYRALLGAAGETPELRGIFIWKWPSYIGYEGSRRSPRMGFTPGGKPAATTLGDFYGRWSRTK